MSKAKENKKLIVGLDIGTSKIAAIVAEVKPNGGFEIIGMGGHPSKGLKKGVVVNIEATVSAIQRALEEAELMADCKISEVFTGIAGSHIKSINSRGMVAIKDREVTQQDVERVIETVMGTLGPIDVLVHNAGGDIAAAGGKPDPNDAVMIKEVDVRAVLDRNLLSTIFVCQRVAPSMMARRSGRIVTLSSVAAFKGRRDSAIYATSKAGVVHYTRCLADQLRPFNVTVNTIAPSDTRTGRFIGSRPVAAERLVEGGTLDRIALVDEVARAIELFAGPMGDFVTGQVLRVDGGTQCWPG